jgi:hypothetical protein
MCGCGELVQGSRQMRYVDDSHRQRRGRKWRTRWRPWDPNGDADQEPEAATDDVGVSVAEPAWCEDFAPGWREWSGRDE